MTWRLIAICLLLTDFAKGATIDELIERYGKKAILENIYKKSGKRAHIRTDDGIKLFNLPDPQYTDAHTLRKDLEMLNITPEQLEQDVIANAEKPNSETARQKQELAHYLSIPPEPQQNLQTHPTTDPASSYIPTSPRRSSKRGGTGGGKGCGARGGPGGSRLPNGKCPSFK